MFFSFTPARGEYRVYQYYITAKQNRSFDPLPHYGVSTLDPVSYVAYHGGKDSVKVDLIRTWICRGDTDGEEICRPPLESFWQKLGI
ncbi:MAG: hypothetical protein OXB84_00525 [Halobacteriovoraceae bacterium]|nr:hypothetical protein [Halobacteriovoraceae bacterium]